jgi:hypothetical protein
MSPPQRRSPSTASAPATGKLTPMPPRTVAGAGSPIGIKVAPGGRYLYITTGTQCLAPGHTRRLRQRRGKHRLGIRYQPGHRRAERQARADRGDRAEPVTGKITPLSPATVTAPSHGSLGVAVTPG